VFAGENPILWIGEDPACQTVADMADNFAQSEEAHKGEEGSKISFGEGRLTKHK
jgi:hypothetical protein